MLVKSFSFSVIGTPTVEEWPDLANFEHFRYPKHAQNRLPEVMRDSVDRRGLKLLKVRPEVCGSLARSPPRSSQAQSYHSPCSSDNGPAQ